jgi:hypothetical protein
MREGGDIRKLIVILFESSMKKISFCTPARVPCCGCSGSSRCALLGQFSSEFFALGLDFVPVARFFVSHLVDFPQPCAQKLDPSAADGILSIIVFLVALQRRGPWPSFLLTNQCIGQSTRLSAARFPCHSADSSRGGCLVSLFSFTGARSGFAPSSCLALCLKFSFLVGLSRCRPKLLQLCINFCHLWCALPSFLSQ